MPLPRSLARFNLRVTNPILGRVAPWLPGFAVVTHVGRRSGVERQTPVNVFRHGDDVVFALTYGTGAQWVRNVQAAGGCTIRTRGRDMRLSDPRVVHDPARRMVPAPVRVPLRAVGVEDFLVMVPADG
ncbi:MAG: nitroreductase family deazaflavin-dependent oxidoreductase [Solirubrobacterales bacterium]